jgi:CRISPR-associated protein Cas2
VRRTFIVAYDISDDYRRDKVFKTLRGFGDHLQYSVFECQLNAADLVRCRHRLGEFIDHKADQVLFVDLGPSEGRGDRVITALGKPYSPIDAPCFVVDGNPE